MLERLQIMQKQTNRVLLINSQALRPRTLADSMLENSLVILKTVLEKNGFFAKISDRNLNMLDRADKEGKLSKRIRKAYKLYFLLDRIGFSVGARFLMGKINQWQLELDKELLKAQQNYFNDILKIIDSDNISIVGIKVWYGDAFQWTIDLVRMIRTRFPKVLLVGGGPQVNVHQQAVLDYSDFDLIVYPEGDRTLLEIAREYKVEQGPSEFCEKLAKSGMDNVMVRGGQYKSSLLELGEKVIPIYGNDKNKKTLIHSLQEARGCDWNECSFCSHPEIFEKYRVRDVDQVMSEIESCLKEGIGIFRFTASDTPLPVATRIAKAILDRKWKIHYSMFSRSMKNAEKRYDRVVEDFILLARSGLRAIFVGGETGHDRINLEIMNKGATASELVLTIKAVKEASKRSGLLIDVTLALIYPTPLVEGVSWKDVFAENLKLVEGCRPDSVIVSPPGVFPRTSWWNDPAKYGFKFGSDYQKHIMLYEYSAYKPPEFWPDMEYVLHGAPMRELLQETSRLRKAIEKMGIQTEITDEYLLMARAAGFEGRQGLEDFKKESLLDILSTDSEFSCQVYESLNARSLALANESLAATSGA